MSSKALAVLKLFLWIICLFHVVVGVGLNVWPEMATTMAKMYGVKVPLTPQLVYLLKPLGAFMLALGMFALIAARNPLAHLSTVYIFAALFAIRGLHRLIFQNDIQRIFVIESGKLMTGMAVFLGMAVVLVILAQVAKKDTA
ncbi:MAG: hypothetical protein K8I00_04120 [Candidatus Omnitrophica bacterium]|nr:hypothetical protein [Candidatus Omnitrophota bacterium]